eukprot:7784466-Pyramimonas_sp.AAC.1
MFYKIAVDYNLSLTRRWSSHYCTQQQLAHKLFFAPPPSAPSSSTSTSRFAPSSGSERLLSPPGMLETGAAVSVVSEIPSTLPCSDPRRTRASNTERGTPRAHLAITWPVAGACEPDKCRKVSPLLRPGDCGRPLLGARGADASPNRGRPIIGDG